MQGWWQLLPTHVPSAAALPAPARDAGLRHGPLLARSTHTKALCAHGNDIPAATGPGQHRWDQSPAAGAAGGARWGWAAVLSPIPCLQDGLEQLGCGGTPSMGRLLWLWEAGAQGMGCWGAGAGVLCIHGCCCPPGVLLPVGEVWKRWEHPSQDKPKAKSSFGHMWPPAPLAPHLTLAFKDSAGPPPCPRGQGG